MTVDRYNKQENPNYGWEEMSERYASLVGTVPGVVYTLDEKGRFTSLSKAAESVMGFTQEELLNRHFSAILHPEDVDSVSRDFILPRFAGIPTGNECSPKLFDERRSWPRKTEDLQVRICPKTGSSGKENRLLKCRVNASGEYVRGRFVGTIGYLYDFSEEDDVSFVFDNKSRYNAFELLAQALSHVFNNVFTGIYGNLQLIEMQMEIPQPFQGNIEAIKTSVEKAVTLIRKLSKSVMAPLDSWDIIGLRQLLIETADELLRRAGIEYKLNDWPTLRRTESDPCYIRHVLRAVFFHIARSIVENGSVNIDARNVAESPIRLPRIDCPYIMVQFEFPKLSGCKDIDRSNDCFQLERTASMALSYELLKKIGGVLSLRSDNGKSVVELYLPAVHEG